MMTQRANGRVMVPLTTGCQIQLIWDIGVRQQIQIKRHALEFRLVRSTNTWPGENYT